MSDVMVQKRRVMGALTTLLISGAPKVRYGRHKMPTHVMPGFVEYITGEGGIYWVIVTGFGLRKDGTRGISRRICWQWDDYEIPKWVRDLILADSEGGGTDATHTTQGHDQL